MDVEVVAVGSELVDGLSADSNSSWLARAVAARGAQVRRVTLVGDDQERLAAVIGEAIDRADVVVVGGGLGPTSDDVTREALAEALGVPLRRDPGLARSVRSWFAAHGREMSENNLRQADVPEGAEAIPARVGTAPGLRARRGRTTIFLLPGVPVEFREMAERAVLPALGEAERVASDLVVEVHGRSESAVAHAMAGWERELAAERASVAYLASPLHGVEIRIRRYGAPAALEAARAHDAAALQALFGSDLAGPPGVGLEEAVHRALAAGGWTLAVAESLTGGMVASRLVAVPGASRHFVGGVVAYHPEVKQTVLGVPPGPVVSAVAVRAMADGVRRLCGADVGLSLSGVAGPEEEEGQPIGTLFVGRAGPGEEIDARRFVLGGPDRTAIRTRAATSALDLLRRALADRVRSVDGGAGRTGRRAAGEVGETGGGPASFGVP